MNDINLRLPLRASVSQQPRSSREQGDNPLGPENNGNSNNSQTVSVLDLMGMNFTEFIQQILGDAISGLSLPSRAERSSEDGPADDPADGESVNQATEGEPADNPADGGPVNPAEADEPADNPSDGEPADNPTDTEVLSQQVSNVISGVLGMVGITTPPDNLPDNTFLPPPVVITPPPPQPGPPPPIGPPPPPILQIQGGATITQSGIVVEATDDEGPDRYELAGDNSSLTVTGDQGSNTYVIRGKDNKYDIQNLDSDDDTVLFKSARSDWDISIEIPPATGVPGNYGPPITLGGPGTTLLLVNKYTGTTVRLSSVGDEDFIMDRLQFQKQPIQNFGTITNLGA